MTPSVKAGFICAGSSDGRSRLDADVAPSEVVAAVVEDDEACVTPHLAITMAKKKKTAGPPIHSHALTNHSIAVAGILAKLYSAAVHSSRLSALALHISAVIVQRTMLGT